jgi:ssDNA-binding Zn-finger/Zn-ribbon topoisomerase 1
LLNEKSAEAAELAAKVIASNPAGAPVKSHSGTTTDIDCDECGKPMLIRSGRRGYFLGCSGYPKCKNTGEVPAKLVDELDLNNKADSARDKPETPIPHTDVEDAAA